MSENKVESLYDFCIKNHMEYLLEEWNNPNISYKNVKRTSKNKYNWKCRKCLNTWDASPLKRTVGRGCPICAGKKVIAGYNDFASLAPELLKEWDYDKNELKPTEITVKSNYKIWWKCKKGHSWIASPNNRVRLKSGCPYCSPSTSIPEICILLALKKLFKNVEHKKIINNIEYDIFVNDLNLAIEYDGEFYHKDRRNLDNRKEKNAKELNFYFIRIYEVKGLVELDEFRIDKNILYLQSNVTKNYPLLCYQVLSYIERKFKIKLPKLDLNNIEIEARNYRENKSLENSLENKYPNIAKEWHPIKNGDLKPSSFPPKSNYKAWWICNKGHEWKTTIAHRVEGSMCPYCFNLGGRKNRQGIDLEEWCYENNRLDLLKEWDYDKNEKKPCDYTKGSDKEVWWICQKGHSYLKPIRNRTKYVNTCPYCKQNKV